MASKAKKSARERPSSGKWWFECSSTTELICVRKNSGPLKVKGVDMENVTNVHKSSDSSAVKVIYMF